MATQYEVNEVLPTDPQLVALVHELWLELDEIYGPNPGTEFRPEDLQDAVYFVAREAGGGAVGCAAVVPWIRAEALELKRMYVRPAGRGRGVSGALLSAAYAQTRAQGLRRLCLETGVRQPAATACYVRAGFVPVPAWPPYDTDPLSRCFEKFLEEGEVP